MNKCPHCKQQLGSARGVTTTRKPRKGDATICGACGALLTFDTFGRLARWPKKEPVPEYLRPLLTEARRQAHIEAVNPVDRDAMKHDVWRKAGNH